MYRGGGAAEPGRKKSKNAFRPVPVTQLTFPSSRDRKRERYCQQEVQPISKRHSQRTLSPRKRVAHSTHQPRCDHIGQLHTSRKL